MIKAFSRKSCSTFFMVIFLLTLKGYSIALLDDISKVTTCQNNISIKLNGGGNSFSLERKLKLKTISVPPCTTLSSPLSGTVGVPVDAKLSWNEVLVATGYKLTVGTVSGGTDILDAIDVGDVLVYDLIKLPQATTIYVTITPYNLDGDAKPCKEEHFNTFAPGVLRPVCTELIEPSARDTRVPLEANLSWNEISNAEGYILTVGTTSGGTDILNMLDVETALNYTLNLPEFTKIYVSITPYNISGNADRCEEETFTTESLTPVPMCSELLLPLPNATNVPVDTDVSWSPISDATGYMLILETFTTGTDVLNLLDVKDVTNYSPPGDLPKHTKIFVTIVPYNDGGEALGCIEDTFVTGEIRAEEVPPKFFTPNNDGRNDYWIVPDPLKKVSHVLIYNRYGKLLEQVNNISVGWDGLFNGNPLPNGDYWYQIRYIEDKVTTGHFSLIR